MGDYGQYFIWYEIKTHESLTEKNTTAEKYFSERSSVGLTFEAKFRGNSTILGC